MKKVGIITITDHTNIGNRLQNYAVQECVKRLGYNVETIENIHGSYNENYIYILKNKIKSFVRFFSISKKHRRQKKFFKFGKKINISKIKVDSTQHISDKLENEYDYFIVGSDQVWNPELERLTDFELINFADKVHKISFSASFGIRKLPEKYKMKTREALKKFDMISVRENEGRYIIADLNINKNVEVLVDPTMLLTAEKWDTVSSRPKCIKDKKKYILMYFLGEIQSKWYNEIKRIAEENNCNIVNLLDRDGPYYTFGPSEFLYLEKNAFLVCTDSFHASVFSIIYDTPFIVFNRKDDLVSMNSRLDTLLSKFELENRKFNGDITDDLLNCDYSNADKILEKEREKAMKFLQNALDIKE